MRDRVMGELKKIFRPEFLNRIDEVLVFHKLSREQIMEIIELMLNRLREQLKERQLNVELTAEARELLVEQGYDPTMGARPLRRAIQRMVEDVLADQVLAGKIPIGSTIVMGREDDHLVIAEVLGRPDQEALVSGEVG